MEPYDDNGYMALVEQLNEIVWRILDMEGNTATQVREEVDTAIENHKPA